MALTPDTDEFSQFLRLAFLRSPNFLTGVSGWTINQDGSAEFNNVTIRGGLVISGTDLKYSGPPAAGNLVQSTAAAAGTDSFGNAYLAGNTTYALISGTFYAVQQVGRGFTFLTAATEAGPWTNIASIIPLAAGVLEFFASSSIYLSASNKALQLIGPSGDVTGATDSANISGAIGPNVEVHLLPGTYYLNAPLAVGANLSLSGAGASTTVQPGSGWAGAELINITGSGATVRNLTLYGGTAVTTSNPNADGIHVAAAQNVTLENLFFQNLNGWQVVTSGNTSGGYWMNLGGVSNAGGYHVNAGASVTAGMTMVQVGNAQTGVSTGPAANLDAMLIEDSTDVIGAGLSPSVGNATTGHSLHVKGNCAGIFVNGFDIGGFPTPAAGSGVCGLKMEQNAGGVSPKGCGFSNGIFQTHDIGISLQNNTADIIFQNVSLQGNNHSGAIVNAGNFAIEFLECVFGTDVSNGQAATGTNYDLDWQAATGTGKIAGCWFGSAIEPVLTAGVQASVHFANNFLNVHLLDPVFAGANNASGNHVATNVPLIYKAFLQTGTIVLVGGTITVNTALVTATTHIRLGFVNPSANAGALFVSALVSGTSFTIKSTNAADTSTVYFELLAGP